MSAAQARQRARITEPVHLARTRSPYYRERYKGLPSRISDVGLLPPVTKAELMENFDGWVTDPEVTRMGVEAFVSDPSLIGLEYLDRYMLWCGSTLEG